jgi:hypothetical protein
MVFLGSFTQTGTQRTSNTQATLARTEPKRRQTATHWILQEWTTCRSKENSQSRDFKLRTAGDFQTFSGVKRKLAQFSPRIHFLAIARKFSSSFSVA